MSNHIKQIKLPDNTTYDIVTPYNLTIGDKVFNGSTAVIVEAKDMGLGNAMRYIGTTTTAITDDATTNPITIGGESVIAVSGDVIIYGTKEFIWNGSKWEEFGAPLAASGVTPGTYGPSANVTGSNNATINVPEITVDAYGRVTTVTNRVYTSKDSNTTYSYPSILGCSSSTAAATAAKTASLSGFNSTDLKAGTNVFVQFTQAHTSASAATLNIGDSGAKTIYRNGNTITSSNANSWVAYQTIHLVYDGTYWQWIDMPATEFYVDNAIASSITTALNTAV